jgi:glycosyltransferase involved in cell wall biosynthesis/ADP-heptose:LPS heptosyltransferase
MRIFALVADAFGGSGGIAKFNRDLLTALCTAPGVERVVALPRLLSAVPGPLPDKLEFNTCGAGGKIRYAAAVLRSAIRNRQSAVVVCGHINLLPLAFLARKFLRPLASGHPPPLLLVIHGIEAWRPTSSTVVNRLIRRVDVAVAVSEFTRKKFWDWAQPKRARSFILPNCVDLALFTPGPKNAALLDRYQLRDKTVMLTVARLSALERYKGIDEVLEVVPTLAREIPNLRYLIVGDGTDRGRLQRKADQLGLRDRVIFAGHVPEAEKVDHYRLADAFVMPGWGEGFGIVYLEAVACGVPVVASNLDASAELVVRCHRVVAVNPQSPSELCEGILKALALGRSHVRLDLEHYSEDRFSERTHHLFGACSVPPRNILVFRIGQLGDTIVALPAMWAARKHFANARLTLLSDRHLGKPARVPAEDLLRNAGIFDSFESYVVDDSPRGRVLRPLRMAALALRLRRLRFDTLVYLAPSARTSDQIERDRRFFAIAGLKNFVGMKDFSGRPPKISGQPLASTVAESDLLLKRLAADGIPVPAEGKASFALGLAAPEEAEVNGWLARQPDDGGRAWLGIGPGSKMPAKRWPEDRFREVVAELVHEFDVWPVVFGGTEDAEIAGRLVRFWGRGFNAAGELSLRGAAAGLRRCTLYLGNDTGTMHLAASVEVPCVAVFSARNHPGLWNPYGADHRVLRAQIDCEGCGLVICVERQNESLRRIDVQQVLAACRELICKKGNPPASRPDFQGHDPA